MQITNVLGLPEPIVTAVREDDYDPGRCDFTATGLLEPPQKVALTRAHWNEMTEDASDRIYALMGQAIHSILERAAKGGAIERVEERLYRKIVVNGNTYIVGGRFDRMALLPNRVLQDYKVMSVWEVLHGIKKERVLQLNILRWILAGNDIVVDDLEVVGMFRDWSKLEAKRNKSLPRHQVGKFPIETMDLAAIQAWIHDRIVLHVAAREGNLPECSTEDRWAKPTKFAVMRQGTKKAVRLFDDEAEATTFAAKQSGKIFIEKRPGGNTRCESYCSVAPFCAQYAKLKAETADDDPAAEAA